MLNRNPKAIKQYLPPYFFLPQPPVNSLHFLSLWMCLFYIHQVEIISVYIYPFCVWLISLSIIFSRVIHVLAVLEFYSFSLYRWIISHCMYISHLIYLFILLDMCIAVPFWLLSMMLLWTWMYTYLLRSLLSVLMNIYLKVRWPHHKVVLLFKVLRICHAVFKRVAPFPTTIHKDSNLWCFFCLFVFCF